VVIQTLCPSCPVSPIKLATSFVMVEVIVPFQTPGVVVAGAEGTLGEPAGGAVGGATVELSESLSSPPQPANVSVAAMTARLRRRIVLSIV
jgi:hypothetical protein